MIPQPQPAPSRPTPPAPGAQQIGTEQLRTWIERRRKVRRRLTIVGLSVLVSGIAVVAVVWGTFHQQFLTIGHLQGLGFMVEWELNKGNLFRGGVSIVSHPVRWTRSSDDLNASDLASIALLNHVITLDLSTVPLRDDDLYFLPRLEDLRELHLERASDFGHAFNNLSVKRSLLTDRALEHIRGLKQLTALSLGDNKITDDGLDLLKDLQSLKFLDLANTGVTDAGLKKVAKLRALETLDLEGTKVTDAGLDALKGLKSLKFLRVEKTPVTTEGVIKFQGSRPDVEVVRDSSLNTIY
jgi:hypothetical protein